MSSAKKSVSIRPSSAREANLIEDTAGDVIRDYHIRESKRKRNAEDSNQSDVPVRFRFAPDGLLESLEGIAEFSGFSKPTITKCLSHHAMCWYQNMPQVVVLANLYKAFLAHSDGFPDISRRTVRDDYEFLQPRETDSRSNSLRSVAFIVSYFAELGKALGIPSYKLFLAGLCWSISTNAEGWSSGTVSKFLAPEAKNMQMHIAERILSLDFAEKVIKFRQGDPLTIAYVKSLLGER